MPSADGVIDTAQATKINEDLATKSSKRTILGLRYAEDLSRRVIRILVPLEVEILKTLSVSGLNSLKTPAGKMRRAQALLVEIRKEIRRRYQAINRLTQAELLELADLELKFAQKGVADAASSVGVSLGIGMPTDAVFAAMFDDMIVQGSPLKDWWAQQESRFFMDFAQAVRNGITAGETTDQIARRFAGDNWGDLRSVTDEATSDAIRRSRRGARSLVRTSVASVQGVARQAVYDANSDVITELAHLSRLDSRTSDACLARAGKRWDSVTKEPIGHGLQFRIPPIHPNCRSVLIPVVKGGGRLAKDLGADDWINSMTDDEQDDLLGRGKAALFRDGKIKASELIDQSDRPMTLEQLAAKS